MDIEGFVRGRLTKGEDEEELKSILAERIKEKLTKWAFLTDWDPAYGR